MLKRKIRLHALLIAALLLAGMTLSGCIRVNIEYHIDDSRKAGIPDTGSVGVEEDPMFGNVFADISEDEFNALGFSYGDSVNVTFSNGRTIEDIPYYTGYYTPAKAMLVVAYPGNDRILIAKNYGILWKEFALSPGDTARISLAEPGKYRDIQEVLGKRYANDREAYESDEEFANYRNVKTGRISDDTLYRSASPCDNKYNRASYTDDLIRKDKIRTILDLGDGKEDIEDLISRDDFASPYFRSLHEAGAVIPVNLTIDYTGDEFREKLCRGLRLMTDGEGPYLVNCLEGKDRTGFVLALLEALTGASYDEMLTDYMLSYENYFGLDRQSDPKAYEMIKTSHFDPMFRYMTGLDDVADATQARIELGAEEFLLGGGMTPFEVRLLKERLTRP